MQDQGRFAEAIAAYEQARMLAPNLAEAHNGLGGALHRQGQPAAAAASYKRAVALKPADVAILNNLAGARLDSGEQVKALAVLQRSLAIAETAEARDLFAACVKSLSFIVDTVGVREPLRRALVEAWVRPAELARAAAMVLASDRPIGAAVTRVSLVWPSRLIGAELLDTPGLAPIAGDKLLRALLEATPVCDIALERWLTTMRAHLLKTAMQAGPGDAPGAEEVTFWCALAHQCFLNEYVFDVSADETAWARCLCDELDAALTCDGPIAALRLVAVAAYLPLGTLAAAPRLLDRIWPDAVAACASSR